MSVTLHIPERKANSEARQDINDTNSSALLAGPTYLLRWRSLFKSLSFSTPLAIIPRQIPLRDRFWDSSDIQSRWLRTAIAPPTKAEVVAAMQCADDNDADSSIAQGQLVAVRQESQE